MPKLSSRLSASDPLGGPGRSHIGVVGNAIEGTGHKGLIYLRNEGNNAGGSNERLYDGMSGSANYTTAYPGVIDDEQKQEYSDIALPLHHIRVREDVRVDTSSRSEALAHGIA